ncbi:Ribonuclease VapC [Candidatus Desulfarcum epimagneticum]|uniref:Ribonuclease VapC n=1 Tax=uncultured Desulfobacteraceae bacterium TaxID=218296 RepID=A0A484HQH6_9BACT|nr:Ribonuclease VapC [uncultured Desulfobacteraceae bacterium]
MFAIDTNLLVYAHNADSDFNEKAVAFLERVLNERDEDGKLGICIPAQVLTEFINVITRHNVRSPLPLSQAIIVVQDYLNTGVSIITQKESQIYTFLDQLSSVTTRKNIFDIALIATLRDNGVRGIYTVNVSDFKGFDFLEVVNPLE